MELKHLKHASRHDNLDLDVLLALPEKSPVGLVQIAHGMAEYKERYLPFLEYLTDHGYAVLIHDHRGHGKSVKSEADLGWFGDDAGNAIVEDLHDLSVWFKNQYPGLPLYLFGHSMGSLVVRKYLKKYDSDIAKLVVCGSPSANPASGLAVSLASLVTKAKGDRHRSPLLNNLSVGGYDKGMPGDVPNRWLSANPANVDAYNEDPRTGFVFTANGFSNLFSLLRDAYSKSGWAMANPDLPIFFIAGADDPVILSEKDWNKAQDFLRQRGYRSVSGKLYPGLRHEILNEKEAPAVMADVLAFLQA